MTPARTVAPNHGGRANTRGRAVVASCIYGCTKLQASIADAGSIPATSTTTGVHGFDGMWMGNGQLVMVPAASGSAESRRPVRWAKFQTPTMTSTQSAKRPDVPAGRGVTNAGTLAGFGPLAPYFQRCDVAWPLGLGKRAETFPKKGSIPSHDANFNAGLLTTATLGRLKHEIGPTCHDANRRAQLAHSAGQGSTAQPGGRRPSQSPAFTSPRWSGALCLTRGFLYAPVPSVCRVCQSAKNPLDLGPVDSGCGPVPKRGANFNAPPRTTTLATGNYGNGWRFFYQSRRRAAAGPLPALAGLSFYGVAERIERIANRSVRQTVVARKAAA